MFAFSKFHAFFRRAPHRGAVTKRAKRHPSLRTEPLEDRKLMAVLAFDPGSGDLVYTAGAGVANDFAIEYEAGTNRYKLTDVEPIHYLGAALGGVVGNHTPVISFSAAGIDSFFASLGDGAGIFGDRATVWRINDTLTLDAGDGNDVVNVLNASHAVTVLGGAGDDQIDIGQIHEQPFADLDGIQAPVHVLGQGGNDTLWVSDFDYPDLTPHTYWITQAAVQREGVATMFYDGTVENVRLNAGCGADVVNAWATSASTQYIVSLKAGGRDTLHVGSPNGTLDTILGRVTVLGEQGEAGPVDTVVLNDQFDPTANNYTVRADTVLRNGTEVLAYRSMERMLLNAGTNNDAIFVESVGTATTATQVTVNAGAGNDTITVGRLGTMNGITSRLNVNGQAGNDTLIFNDQADPNAHGYTLRTNLMQRSGSGPVYYGNTERLTLNAGMASDVITVRSTLATTSVTVNAGGGNDMIHVGDAGRVTGVLGPLMVNGQAGVDTLLVHDAANGPDLFVRTPLNILRNGVVLLSYLGMEAFVIEP